MGNTEELVAPKDGEHNLICFSELNQKEIKSSFAGGAIEIFLSRALQAIGILIRQSLSTIVLLLQTHLYSDYDSK